MAKAMQDYCTDADAASALSGDHPKSKPVPISKGMTDRTSGDARSPSSFKTGK